MTESPLDLDNNSTISCSGGPYRPDTRTDEERRRDDKRLSRERRVAQVKWFFGGFVPRGWRGEDCCCCGR